jgi:hypothetical protein
MATACYPAPWSVRADPPNILAWLTKKKVAPSAKEPGQWGEEEAD